MLHGRKNSFLRCFPITLKNLKVQGKSYDIFSTTPTWMSRTMCRINHPRKVLHKFEPLKMREVGLVSRSSNLSLRAQSCNALTSHHQPFREDG
jgi:hypothetical protein